MQEKVQESHPQVCVPHRGVGTLQVFGSCLGTRDVTECCSARLLCYYGDEHHGDNRNKCIKIPSSFAPRASAEISGVP